jgi:hypothetical protein
MRIEARCARSAVLLVSLLVAHRVLSSSYRIFGINSCWADGCSTRLRNKDCAVKNEFADTKQWQERIYALELLEQWHSS